LAQSKYWVGISYAVAIVRESSILRRRTAMWFSKVTQVRATTEKQMGQQLILAKLFLFAGSGIAAVSSPLFVVFVSVPMSRGQSMDNPIAFDAASLI
jgi:hypothetical protein